MKIFKEYDAAKQTLKTEKAEVISAKNFDFVTLEGLSGREESNLTNRDSLRLNGCHAFELKQLNL